MTANRRRRFNFAFQHAIEWAEELRKPLFVVEGLNCNYPWASDRIHQFVWTECAQTQSLSTDRRQPISS
jgi:deoxyribodipyrimidine photo-lyase